MNQMYHRKSLNGSLCDNFQMSNHESRLKKRSFNYNTKKANKQAILSGINYPVESNTIFKEYNNFPSLSKCYSSTKMTKSQHNIYYLSKSFISFPKKNKDEFSTSIIALNYKEKDNIKHHRDKSSSTMQSTDERKEIVRLMAQLQEKKDLIQTLNKTIDNYIKDKVQYTKEMMNQRCQLSDYKMENNRLKEEYQYLQDSYTKLKKSMKTIDVSEFLNKDIDIDNKDKEEEDKDDNQESNKYEEQSLSAICFTDKVKMEKTLNNNENNNLPILDFGIIANKREPINVAAINMKIPKPNGKKYNDTMPKHNSKANSNNNTNFEQKIIFNRKIHCSKDNLR